MSETAWDFPCRWGNGPDGTGDCSDLRCVEAGACTAPKMLGLCAVASCLLEQAPSDALIDEVSTPELAAYAMVGGE